MHHGSNSTPPLARPRARAATLAACLCASLLALAGCSKSTGGGSAAVVPATPVIGFASATMSHEENAGVAAVTLELTEPTTSNVNVSIQFAGTATKGDDYTAPMFFTVPAGALQADLPIDVDDDFVWEEDETVILTLTGVNGATIGPNSTTQLTIRDDEDEPKLAWATTSTSIGEDEFSDTVEVVLTPPSSLLVTFDISIGGTATPGIDFDVPQTSFAIVPGDPGTIVLFEVIDDDTAEGDEQFTLTLTNIVGAAPSTSNTVTVTIVDDEAAPLAGLVETEVATSERSGPVELLVQLTDPQPFDVLVPFSITGTADAADYLADASPLVIPAGAVSAAIRVEPIDDGLSEAPESIVVTLEPPIGAGLGPNHTATIEVSDAEILPLVTFTTPDRSISEQGGPFALTVGLGEAGADDVTVQFSTSGTAVDGIDYELDTTSLVIPAGALSGSISISPFADGLTEPVEDLTVMIAGATGATLGARTTVSVFLHDDLAAPCGLDYAQTQCFYTPGTAIVPNVSSVGCGVTDEYSVTPDLPAGLSLEPTTGTITGAPVDDQPARLYTVTASNGVGTTSAHLSIEVGPLWRLTGSSSTVSYDPALGIAAFDVHVFLEEDPDGTPSLSHGISSLSFGIATDPGEAVVQSVEEGSGIAALNGGAGADYFGVSLQPEGVAVGILVSFSQQEWLHTAGATQIAIVHSDVNAALLYGNATGATITLPFVDTLGNPPVGIQVVHAQAEYRPERVDAQVTFTP